MIDRKILLAEKDLPQRWYNIAPDLKTPLSPPLHPATHKPLGPEDLAPIFPMALIAQEMTMDPWVEIPNEVMEILKIWRPTPLVRALSLEKALNTKAHIYYKNESVSPAGSHKPNTAVAQVYYNKQEGVKRIATETGAGQWGSALSFACKLFDLECQVYMVRVSFDQKPYRKLLIQSWGGKIDPSPSTITKYGRAVLAKTPQSTGSLGIAISEAIEDTVGREDTKYSLGSVLNHVMLHQTVIGLEAIEQLKSIGEKNPDVIIGCVGGGSNFAGLAFPFLKDKLKGKTNPKVIAVEPMACPTLTKGLFEYDFGDTAGMTPLVLMYTLGHDFIPPGIHAGGLRYHGMAPIVSNLVKDKVVEARAYHQTDCFKSALLFAQTEGILPAPETSHAIHAAIEEAKHAKEGQVIIFNLSGHGHFDLSSYDAYLSNKLEDYEYPMEKIKEALKAVPKI
ncbi:TrpB-like pyridoxal-phosphate dependent enzyme [candidate division WOR-1 bacterium RIFOXYB2_FULL_42_35]|uniref:Tryptophan synthase beta chain n=1 Tax=candidate division WOR-1 bacterium RIFOXYC2_FULL_41_25 TaxID=1802586 RepID=A0A1F4TN95_UNCSA|nr:MAG: TrpB-like pyridoxal-phosphate dependent enzyme [candidate division WOR-1 bacterium RIFOXYA2_FULL_41_14]OGC24641.1 MAG: TrpB-like pyridoxal-phosphate dependent enzyme [candidate division WOR-1 bacterium RIFOXYB2_FULL_42_35]OGC34156.1 MAG: TrpB-like pyridoxal-phosphate dependent enzyme [candidate division WOR-1 bacterium RIFOXYC2_FULL_41_25]